jgi:DNA-binding response OmpR family regulator
MTQKNLGTVLVMEDDAMLAEMVQDTLEGAGFKLIMASTADKGLEVLRTQPVDAVLGDIVMGAKDGISTLREARSVEQFEVPYIICSGNPSEANYLKALQLGAFDFVAKPFDVADLVKVLTRACDLGRGRRRMAEILEELKVVEPAAALADECVRLDSRTRLIRIANFKGRNP